ncbi:MAG TPA: hypothetical protein VFO62_10575 [Candidatus Binatia bacterium]|nr:hypothetical protein [Candidatus Binatia bacterium]
MKRTDLDEIEKLLATEAADPFSIIEHVPALLAMARRTEEAERERDDARAALVRLLWRSIADDAACSCAPGDACPECRAMSALGLGRWTGAADATREIRALPERTLARPPLDPAHVEVLRGMHRRAALELAGAEHDERVGTMSPGTVDVYRKRAAALQAALGEEARGQSLSDDGTTEGA